MHSTDQFLDFEFSSSKVGLAMLEAKIVLWKFVMKRYYLMKISSFLNCMLWCTDSLRKRLLEEKGVLLSILLLCIARDLLEFVIKEGAFSMIDACII